MKENNNKMYMYWYVKDIKMVTGRIFEFYLSIADISTYLPYAQKHNMTMAF